MRWLKARTQSGAGAANRLIQDGEVVGIAMTPAEVEEGIVVVEGALTHCIVEEEEVEEIIVAVIEDHRQDFRIEITEKMITIIMKSTMDVLIGIAR